MTKAELVQRFVDGQSGSNHNAESFISKSGNSLILYNTIIVEVCNGKVTLNTGGWETVTTKSYMNMVLEALDLPYGICQNKGIWYWTDSMGIVCEFDKVDTINLDTMQFIIK